MARKYTRVEETAGKGSEGSVAGRPDGRVPAAQQANLWHPVSTKLAAAPQEEICEHHGNPAGERKLNLLSVVRRRAYTRYQHAIHKYPIS